VAFAAICQVFCVAARAAECLPDCLCPTPKLLVTQDLAVRVEQAVLQLQYNLLSAMSLQHVEYSVLGPISWVEGDTGFVLPVDALKLREGESGATILLLLKDLLLANDTETLTLKEARFDEYPLVSIGSYWFLQSIRGIPVIDGGVGLKYDGKTNRVTSLVANFIPDRELPRTAKLTAQQAEQIAGGDILEPTYLGYYLACCEPKMRPKLVWAIYSGDERLYVDAITGAVAARINMVSY
jgi:hypothetical protein